MRLVSVDASSQLDVCLLEDGRTMSDFRYAGEGRQSAAGMLLPAIAKSMEEAGWTKPSLDAVVVGVGPGSFTGIRTAIVTARTIAQALNLPLLGISQFECLEKNLSDKLPAAVVLPAGKSAGVMHYFAAGFAGKGGKSAKPAYLKEEELSRYLADFAVWYVQDSLINQAQIKSEIRPLPAIENIAIIQAQIAFDRLSSNLAHQGHADRENLRMNWPWTSVTPLYLRGPSITLASKAIR